MRRLAVEQERDEALGGIGEAGRQIDRTVREEALELDAGSARIGSGLVGRGRIGLGQAKCSFERPFGLPGEWSASRPAFASAPSHPRLPYSVARRSRTVNVTVREVVDHNPTYPRFAHSFATCG